MEEAVEGGGGNREEGVGGLKMLGQLERCDWLASKRDMEEIPAMNQRRLTQINILIIHCLITGNKKLKNAIKRRRWSCWRRRRKRWKRRWERRRRGRRRWRTPQVAFIPAG